MRTRQLHERLCVFVPTYQWQGYSDINMFVEDATLKTARLLAVLQRSPSIRSEEVAIHQNVLTAKMAVFGDHLPLRLVRAQRAKKLTLDYLT
jgi:hypothetical protein